MPGFSCLIVGTIRLCHTEHMLDKKLQLKDGQTIAAVNGTLPAPLAGREASAGQADAVLVFVASEAELRAYLGKLQANAAQAKLTWVAYPKAGQLNTNINRDSIRAITNDNGLDPVRQIALDETWSAMRLKAL